MKASPFLMGLGLLALSAQLAGAQSIFFDDFESYTSTAEMNAPGAWGDNGTTGNPSTLQTSGGNPGQYMFHPGGVSAQRSFAPTVGTDDNPLVFEFDFLDDGVGNKRLTGGLRGSGAILEVGRFNNNTFPEGPTSPVDGYGIRTVSIDGSPFGNRGWVLFEGEASPQAGWHSVKTTVRASDVTFELDLDDDGTVDATRVIETAGGAGIAYDVARLGGPSNLSSAGGGLGFDNVRLSTFENTGTIAGVFNTGVNASGNALPADVVDPHFSVHQVGSAGDAASTGRGAPTFVVPESNFPSADITTKVQQASTAEFFDGQIATNDVIAGQIGTELPGDNGWHPANTDPLDQLPALTDGTGIRSTNLTGLLNDFPTAGQPTKLVQYDFDATDIDEINILTGNQGADGRVFSTARVLFSTDNGLTFEELGYFESNPPGGATRNGLGFGSTPQGLLLQDGVRSTLLSIARQDDSALIEGATNLQIELFSTSNTGGVYADPFDGVNPFTGVDDGVGAAFESPLVFEIDVLASDGTVFNSWVANAPDSAWIAPVQDDYAFAEAGVYDYVMEFDLSSEELAGFRLDGLWATDEAGLDIFINGVSTGQTSSGSSSLSSFSITDGFVAGLNTLVFRVENGGTEPNPTGLRVTFTDAPAPPVRPIPEPSTLALLAVGVAFVTARRQR